LSVSTLATVLQEAVRKRQKAKGKRQKFKREGEVWGNQEEIQAITYDLFLTPDS
jgi:hypothetical protein